MQIDICDDYQTLSHQAAQLIAQCVRQKPDAVLCLAGGDTPRGTYSALVELAKAGQVDFSHARFVGLDEWVGLPASYPGSCAAFMYESLFSPLALRAEQIIFFDAVSCDLPAECARVDAFLQQQGPLDFALLGMGMNGHLGMNEPGCDSAASCCLTELAQTTLTVGQKYFSGSPPLLKQGITVGMAPLLAAKQVVLIVSGPRKAATLAAVIHGPISNALPASLLRQHPQAQLFADRAAASQLVA